MPSSSPPPALSHRPSPPQQSSLRDENDASSRASLAPVKASVTSSSARTLLHEGGQQAQAGCSDGRQTPAKRREAPRGTTTCTPASATPPKATTFSSRKKQPLSCRHSPYSRARGSSAPARGQGQGDAALQQGNQSSKSAPTASFSVAPGNALHRNDELQPSEEDQTLGNDHRQSHGVLPPNNGCPDFIEAPPSPLSHSIHPAQTLLTGPFANFSAQSPTQALVASSAEVKDYSPLFHNADNERQQMAHLRAPGEQAASVSPTNLPWSAAEDAVLLTAVKQHGEDWERVVATINAGHQSSRLADAVGRRYQRLKLLDDSAAARASVASNAASASASRPTSVTASQQQNNGHQQQQQPQQQPQLPPAATAPVVPPRKKGSLWSQEEDATLVALRASCRRPGDVWPAFCRAFPGTNRTREAVKRRWTGTLLPELEVQKKASGTAAAASAAAHTSASQGPSAVAVAHLQSLRDAHSVVQPVAGAAGASTMQGRAKPAQHDPTLLCSALEPARTGPTSLQPIAPDKTTPAPAPPAAVASRARSRAPSPSPHYFTTPTLPAAPTARNPTPASLPAPPITQRFTIETLPNGFHVRHLSPRYELHIHAETLCEIVKTETASLTPPVKLEEGEAEQEQSTAAPFVFRAGEEGYIQALRLPVGTETTIEFFDDGSAEEGEGEEKAAGGGQRDVAEVRFDAVDGYCVIFVI